MGKKGIIAFSIVAKDAVIAISLVIFQSFLRCHLFGVSFPEHSTLKISSPTSVFLNFLAMFLSLSLSFFSLYDTYYHLIGLTYYIRASQVALVVKNLPANAGDLRHVGSIPGLGRSPGGGHGNPLQYLCLENPTDREAWRATVHRVMQRQTRL